MRFCAMTLTAVAALGGDAFAQTDGRADPRAALRKKLGEFVRAGKLTREEAVDLYQTAFPGKQPRPRGRRMDLDVKDPAGFGKDREKPIFSGPQAGEKLPALKVIPVGRAENKLTDAVAAAGGGPQVIFVMNGVGTGVRGAFSFSDVAKRAAGQAKLHSSIVFLGDDRNALTKQLTRMAKVIGPRFDLVGVSPDGKDGPGSYGLNRNVRQTVILAKGGKVTHTFAFPQGMLRPDPHVLGALAALLGVDRDAFKGRLAEAAAARGRMRRKRD